MVIVVLLRWCERCFAETWLAAARALMHVFTINYAVETQILDQYNCLMTRFRNPIPFAPADSAIFAAQIVSDWCNVPAPVGFGCGTGKWEEQETVANVNSIRFYNYLQMVMKNGIAAVRSLIPGQALHVLWVCSPAPPATHTRIKQQ